MRRLPLIGSLLALALVAGPVPTAAAAVPDSTTTAVACTPSPVGVGAATTCTATVADTATAPSGGSPDGGTVTFGASPSTGTFSSSGACTLVAIGTGQSADCQVTFTPAAGGAYTINASYAGDAGHVPSAGSTSVSTVDATTTTLACFPATISIGESATCAATLTDPSNSQSPVGEVTFSASPSGGTFGPAGVCNWQPAGSGGSATCPVSFIATAAVGYTLTAGYSGDDTHAASTGSFTVTGTGTPAGGGPGSHPGTGTLTIPVTTPTGTLSISSKGTVSTKHIAALTLSCRGQSGATCAGTVKLSAKVKVKVKGKVKGKGKHHSRKPKTKTKTETVVIGSANFNLTAGPSKTVNVKLSSKGYKLFRHAKRGRFKVTAISGTTHKTVTLTKAKVKKKKKKHHKHKKKKKK